VLLGSVILWVLRYFVGFSRFRVFSGEMFGVGIIRGFGVYFVWVGFYDGLC